MLTTSTADFFMDFLSGGRTRADAPPAATQWADCHPEHEATLNQRSVCSSFPGEDDAEAASASAGSLPHENESSDRGGRAQDRFVPEERTQRKRVRGRCCIRRRTRSSSGPG